MQTFIAFPASQRLAQTTNAFIIRSQAGCQTPDSAAMTTIMTAFAHEALETYFNAPAKRLGLSRPLLKLVTGAVTTIEAAAGQIIKRTAPRLDITQGRALAHYMDIMRIQPDANSDSWWVAFPLQPSLAADYQHCLDTLACGQPEAARRELQHFLFELTDAALFWYFEKPIKLLHLGPVLTRLCRLGNETSRRASRQVIERVIARLDPAQLKQVTAFVNALMIECEPRLAAQRLDSSQPL